MKKHLKSIGFVLILVLAGVAVQARAITVVRMETGLGNVYLELYEDVAPVTVANFLTYTVNGDYDGTFFHRSIPGFVLQGGGYHLVAGSEQHIPQLDPIVNEFSLSNARGTLAMAKLAGDPDSATSEWFFNLDDNGPAPTELDIDNGGYTVFGRVLGDGMEVVDRIGTLSTINAGGPLVSLPVQNYEGGDLVESNYVFLNRVIELPRVAVVPGAQDFGQVGVDAAGADREVLVINQGVNDLAIGQVGALDGLSAPFSIVTDTCSNQVLVADDRCSLVIRFSPSALGDFTESFSIPTDDPDTPVSYVQLSGTGSPPLSVNSALGMRGVVVGESKTRALTVSNVSGLSVTITGISISGTNAADFIQTNDCTVLGPNETCAISVTFTPGDLDSRAATLSITTDYPDQALVEVALTGTGLETPVPNLGVSATGLDIGDVFVGKSYSEILSLINGGGADLVFNSLSITGADASEFSVSGDCTTTLQPQRTCKLTVLFSPVTTGAKSATLLIATNDADLPTFKVRLMGFGRDSWNRASLDAGNGQQVIVQSQAGTVLTDLAEVDIPSPGDAPGGVSFRQGFYQFSVQLVGRTEAAVVISFPEDVTPPSSYYKFGPTPDNATPHWYEFMWDGTTGARITKNVVTLYFVDGERGDSDLAVNGTIEDPGAPAYPLSTSSAGGGDSGGGGGCALSVRSREPWEALDQLALWLLLAGSLLHRRRRARSG